MASLEQQEKEQAQQRPTFDSIGAIKAQLMKEVQAKLAEQGQQDSFYDHVMGFVHAINWREPWIIGLLAAHGLLFVAAVCLRHSSTGLGVLFFLAVGVIFLAEQLNALAGAHWQSFAGQDYFDEHGVFFSALVSAPLLCLMFVILVLYLIQVSRMMVAVKKKQLLLEARKRQQQQQEQGKADSGSKKDR